MDEKQMRAKADSDRRHHAKVQQRIAQNYVDANTLEVFQYDDDAVLVFLDESGDVVPSMVSREFCMGGITLSGREYSKLNVEWLQLKMNTFGLKPNEGFHSTEHLRKLDQTGIWELERFFLINNLNVIVGWDPLNSMYTPDIQPFLASVSPLGVIESQLDQIYSHKSRHEHWIIEKSGKHDWRMMAMGMRGEPYFHFPKTKGSRLSFVNKRQMPLCGLEIADLIIYLFRKLNPDISNTLAVWRASRNPMPPNQLRIYQAAIGVPFPPLCGKRRRPAYGLSFV